MPRALPVAAGALLLTACGSATIRGRLVDPMNGDTPLAGEVLLARAVGAVRLTCQSLSGTTDDEGRFEIPGLCMRETAYRLEPSNPSLILADAESFDVAGGDLVIRGWWAPEGEGTWILDGRSMLPVPLHAELAVMKVGEASVAYPRTLPESPPQVTLTEHLVITGVDEVGEVVFAPLVPSPARTFDGVPMAPWSYLGARFVDDLEAGTVTVERVTAEPDPAKVRDVSRDDRAVRYVAGDALPAGLYAVFHAGRRRASIVQFGD